MADITGTDDNDVLNGTIEDDVIVGRGGSDRLYGDDGGAGRPDVTGLPAITSSAGSDNTYAIGDDIAATVTFSAAIAVTGTPQLKIKVGTVEKTAACAAHSSDNKKLVCTYTVAAGDADSNGIEIEANKLTLPSGATLRQGNHQLARTYSAVRHVLWLARVVHIACGDLKVDGRDDALLF